MRRCIAYVLAGLLVIATFGCGGGSSSSTNNSQILAGTSGYLYVVNSTDATISGFAISPSGALTPVAGGSVATGLTAPTGIATNSAGTLYVGSATSREVLTYRVGLRSGQLSAPSPLPAELLRIFTWTNPAHLVNCGTHLFAFGEGFGPSPSGTQSIGWSGFAFPLNTDGSMSSTPGWGGFGTFDAPPVVSNGFMDSTCRYVFHANTAANEIEQVTFDVWLGGSSMAAHQGSPTGSAPVWVSADPSAKFVYAANSASNNISAFSTDLASGRLTQLAGSPVTAGMQPSSVLVVAPWVYVTNAGDNTVSAYTQNQTTGELSPVPGSPFPVGNKPVFLATASTDVAHSPSGTLLYVVNENSNNISAFAIGTDGSLQSVAGSPFPTGRGPKAMAVLVP